MIIRNPDRMLVKILRDVCEQRGITLKAFSDDWIFCLQYESEHRFVFGYSFDLNLAGSVALAKDKTATSDILGHFNIPRVEHRIFHGPQLRGFVPPEGNWLHIVDYWKECNCDVVCKPNEGSGGVGVTRVRSQIDLECAVEKLFISQRSICLSPWLPIEEEYRVGILRNKVEFIYRKSRPSLRGDGKQTVRELVLAKLNAENDAIGERLLAGKFQDVELDYGAVPADGETVPLNWKHNLGLGALPELLSPGSALWRPFSELADQSVRALRLNVASVDIALVNGQPMILEINSGIMMESIAQSSPQGFEIARSFYDKIVCAMFDI